MMATAERLPFSWRDVESLPDLVTCAIMCQAGKGYSLWLCKSHEQEHPDVTANCDD